MLSNPTAGFSTDFWVSATSKIPPGMAQQYAIGIEKSHKNYEASLELYFKNMNHLISFKEGEVLN